VRQQASSASEIFLLAVQLHCCNSGIAALHTSYIQKKGARQVRLTGAT
jgi:hypothetical protein